ncbi:LysR family transcriptional regulator [Leisingera sp. M658]|uniref:LysR family transcriptional regulator n=1 Tax=Leisingera sp. M658 TaxID=2867015 RepID=UPI0021A574BD|nr:LysR family transcriptional regulator [Leisingera sp. M658]UWQ75828.1 LysR family transcriptional regulator [Leisingera sp. M658]
MRLEWIEDILAVLENGSLSRAAEKRLLTQSAFTRRIRAIEENIGAELCDRNRKPVTLIQGVAALEPELRDLSARLTRVKRLLKQAPEQNRPAVQIACQHALTTTLSSSLIQAISSGDQSIRIRSGNRDECMRLLFTDEVEIAITYEMLGETTTSIPGTLEKSHLGDDTLIPVCAPQMEEAARSAEIPIISYPSEVYLGQIFYQAIVPRIAESTELVSKAETALTLAMLQFARDALGVAWLPVSLVSESLANGQLVDVSDCLPSQNMAILMSRLPGKTGTQTDQIWKFYGVSDT